MISSIFRTWCSFFFFFFFFFSAHTATSPMAASALAHPGPWGVDGDALSIFSSAESVQGCGFFYLPNKLVSRLSEGPAAAILICRVRFFSTHIRACPFTLKKFHILFCMSGQDTQIFLGPRGHCHLSCSMISAIRQHSLSFEAYPDQLPLT
jgi:hypothetical protein